MIDLITNLTWQHQVLLVETIFSVLAGIYLAVRGVKRTPARGVFFLLYNAVLYWLLFSGAERTTWQYVVIAAWYTFDSAVVIWANFSRNVTQPKTLTLGVVLAGAVVAFFLLTLLISGGN